MAEAFLRETKGGLDAAADKIKAFEWEPLPWPKRLHAQHPQRVLKVWERTQAKK